MVLCYGTSLEHKGSIIWCLSISGTLWSYVSVPVYMCDVTKTLKYFRVL